MEAKKGLGLRVQAAGIRIRWTSPTRARVKRYSFTGNATGKSQRHYAGTDDSTRLLFTCSGVGRGVGKGLRKNTYISRSTKNTYYDYNSL